MIKDRWKNGKLIKHTLLLCTFIQTNRETPTKSVSKDKTEIREIRTFFKWGVGKKESKQYHSHLFI